MKTPFQRVPRLLVVIDNTAEAAVVLERALDLAGALRGELVLLAVVCEGPPWEAARRPRKSGRFLAEILRRATLLAATRGIPIAERVERGDPADVITRIAGEEECDQIFMAEPASTLADRALSALTSACTGRIAERIISSTGVPVTVVAPKTSS
jgi:nucleotide-binding universal stress UspA family protein